MTIDIGISLYGFGLKIDTRKVVTSYMQSCLHFGIVEEAVEYAVRLCDAIVAVERASVVFVG